MCVLILLSESNYSDSYAMYDTSGGVVLYSLPSALVTWMKNEKLSLRRYECVWLGSHLYVYQVQTVYVWCLHSCIVNMHFCATTHQLH